MLDLLPILAAATMLNCTAVDGDTLRCPLPGRAGEVERVRLIGIDAPELPGHCRQGRNCAQGDARASRESLARLIRGRWVRLERHGKDHYGRTLAFAFVGNVNLSCAQIGAGQAVYRANWDRMGKVGRCR